MLFDWILLFLRTEDHEDGCKTMRTYNVISSNWNGEGGGQRKNEYKMTMDTNSILTRGNT